MISIITCISYYMVSNTKIKDRRFHVYDYFAWLELILFIHMKLWERLTHFIT